MKITCKQQDLSRGLSVVAHAVSSRSTLPILANILLTTDGSKLKLSATNLEVGISAWVDAEILEEGSTTTPTKTMHDLLDALKNRTDSLTLSVDENHTMSITAKGVNATVRGMNPDEFPLVPGAESGSPYVEFDAPKLKECLSMITIAAADDDTRPVLTGVNVKFNQDRTITLASADAFRLAVMECAAGASFSDSLVMSDDIIIPAKGLADLPAYTQLLREHGMPESHIESLTVQFMHEIPAPWVTMVKLFPRPWGKCEVSKNRILLATFYVEEAEDRNKALQELNTVLLHETGHACNPLFTLICMAAMPLVLIVCSYGVFYGIEWALHTMGMLSEMAIRAIAGIAQIATLFLLIKPSYRLAPNERLSRRFEKLNVQIIRE